jgi:hypothetical protein
MQKTVFLIAILCLLVSFPAGAAGTREKPGAPQKSSVPPRQTAPQKPVKQREPAPPPSLTFSGGIDVMLAADRKIGGCAEIAVALGNFGISLNGDVVSMNLAQEADATALGALGYLSFRYYRRASALVGNYLVAFFVGLGAGYGIVGYEDASSSMGGMSYVGLSPVIPFGGEIGLQAVFANHLLVQSLVRIGGASFMGDEFWGMYPLVSVSMSVGMLVE